MDKNLSQKSINNAISAYLMIGISWLFLFNKQNPYINNEFVKKHTKSAIIIHLGFLITFLVFSINDLFSNINILSFKLSEIVSMSLFMFLLGLIVIGIYKAKEKKEFNIINSLKSSKEKKLLDLDKNEEINEKDKLTIILSFIPFIGLLVHPKYLNNDLIQNNFRLNTIISLVITLLFINGYGNLSSLVILTYTIFISFIGITLFLKSEIFYLKINKLISPRELLIFLESIFRYLKNYFSDKNFQEFKVVYENKDKEFKKEYENLKIELEKKSDIKISKKLIYIPIVNFGFLFLKSNRYKIHMINGLTISLFFISIILLSYLGYLSYLYLILLLFPIMYGIGIVEEKVNYKMPIIYDIYNVFSKIFSIFRKTSIDINEKRKTDKKVSLKIKNHDINSLNK